MQELKMNDHQHRRLLANWAAARLEEDPNFGPKIIFSDEAHFWMNGYVNNQNCRIWDDTNPYEVHQVTMYLQKFTACCGFCAGGVIGPYF
jgi:1,4-alpha-glucan branching enzyme